MKDFLLGEDGDFIIENGDLKIGDCIQDNAILIIDSAKGDFKQFPEVGCNLQNRLKGINDEESLNRLKADILDQLKVDGIDAEFSAEDVTSFKLMINND